MLEGVDFKVFYAPVDGTLSLSIITEIEYVEGLLIFVLDIYNAFQNTILPNPAERVYLRLPYIYLDLYKRKCPKHQIASSNQK